MGFLSARKPEWLNEDVHQFLWEQTGRSTSFTYDIKVTAYLSDCLEERKDMHPTLWVPDALQEHVKEK